MLLIFQRFHREICLALLVLFGLACGHLVATILGLQLQIAELPVEKAAPSSKVTRHVKDLAELNFILQRNLFDPSSRGAGQVTLKSDTAQETLQPVIDRKDLTLLGTLVAGADSTALIKIKQQIELFRLDQKLPDGGRIETIERNQLTISNTDGSESILSMQDDVPVKSQPRDNSFVDNGIVPVGINQWKVARRTAEAARENISDQLRLAQMEPRIIDGQTDGFVIKMLNRRSLLASMGMRRGDVVLRVNNMSLDSPEKALQIMQQLREARRLTVDIERNGQPTTLIYELE